MFLALSWLDTLPTKYPVPLAILSFLVHKMEPNNMQVSYVFGWTCTFTTSMLKIVIWLDVHFQSQFNAPPPEFIIGSKIFGCQPDLHFHAPIYAAKATKSILPECFRHMRDHWHIHATRNTVIPSITYAIGRVRCTHMPWHIVNFCVSMVYGT